MEYLFSKPMCMPMPSAILLLSLGIALLATGCQAQIETSFKALGRNLHEATDLTPAEIAAANGLAAESAPPPESASDDAVIDLQLHEAILVIVACAVLAVGLLIALICVCRYKQSPAFRKSSKQQFSTEARSHSLSRQLHEGNSSGSFSGSSRGCSWHDKLLSIGGLSQVPEGSESGCSRLGSQMNTGSRFGNLIQSQGAAVVNSDVVSASGAVGESSGVPQASGIFRIVPVSSSVPEASAVVPEASAGVPEASGGSFCATTNGELQLTAAKMKALEDSSPLLNSSARVTSAEPDEVVAALGVAQDAVKKEERCASSPFKVVDIRPSSAEPEEVSAAHAQHALGIVVQDGVHVEGVEHQRCASSPFKVVDIENHQQPPPFSNGPTLTVHHYPCEGVVTRPGAPLSAFQRISRMSSSHSSSRAPSTPTKEDSATPEFDLSRAASQHAQQVALAEQVSEPANRSSQGSQEKTIESNSNTNKTSLSLPSASPQAGTGDLFDGLYTKRGLVASVLSPRGGAVTNKLKSLYASTCTGRSSIEASPQSTAEMRCASSGSVKAAAVAVNAFSYAASSQNSARGHQQWGPNILDPMHMHGSIADTESEGPGEATYEAMAAALEGCGTAVAGSSKGSSGQVGKGVRSRENSRGSLRGGVASQPLAVSSRFWRPENILEEEPGPAECAAAEESAVNNNNITNISSSAPGSPTGDTWDAKEVSTGADNVEKAYKSLPGAGMLHLDKVESKRSQKRSHGGGHTEEGNVYIPPDSLGLPNVTTPTNPPRPSITDSPTLTPPSKGPPASPTYSPSPSSPHSPPALKLKRPSPPPILRSSSSPNISPQSSPKSDPHPPTSSNTPSATLHHQPSTPSQQSPVDSPQTPLTNSPTPPPLEPVPAHEHDNQLQLKLTPPVPVSNPTDFGQPAPQNTSTISSLFSKDALFLSATSSTRESAKATATASAVPQPAAQLQAAGDSLTDDHLFHAQFYDLQMKIEQSQLESASLSDLENAFQSTPLPDAPSYTSTASNSGSSSPPQLLKKKKPFSSALLPTTTPMASEASGVTNNERGLGSRLGSRTNSALSVGANDTAENKMRFHTCPECVFTCGSAGECTHSHNHVATGATITAVPVATTTEDVEMRSLPPNARIARKTSFRGVRVNRSLRASRSSITVTTDAYSTCENSASVGRGDDSTDGMHYYNACTSGSMNEGTGTVVLGIASAAVADAVGPSFALDESAQECASKCESEQVDGMHAYGTGASFESGGTGHSSISSGNYGDESSSLDHDPNGQDTLSVRKVQEDSGVPASTISSTPASASSLHAQRLTSPPLPHASTPQPPGASKLNSNIQTEAQRCDARQLSSGGAAREDSSWMTRTCMQLDELAVRKVPLLGSYILEGRNARCCTGGAILQFATIPANNANTNSCSYAIKFFPTQQALEHECAMHANESLKALLPPLVTRFNEGEASAGDSPLPPLIVTQSGETLEKVFSSRRPDFFKTVEMLVNFADRLQNMHGHGLVHRDLKRSNILWLRRLDKWVLLEGGSIARSGEEIPLNFSLRNAAPEVAEALQSGHKDVLPQPSQDAWGLGVTVFELLAGSPAYDLQNATHVEAVAQLRGEQELPWEGMRAHENEQHFNACMGSLQGPIMQLLQRNPHLRPCMSSFACMCRRLLAPQPDSDAARMRNDLIEIRDTTDCDAGDTTGWEQSDSDATSGFRGVGVGDSSGGFVIANRLQQQQQQQQQSNCDRCTTFSRPSTTGGTRVDDSSTSGALSDDCHSTSFVAELPKQPSLGSRMRGPAGNSSVISAAGVSRGWTESIYGVTDVEAPSGGESEKLESQGCENSNSNLRSKAASSEREDDVTQSQLTSLHCVIGGLSSVANTDASGQVGQGLGDAPALGNPSGWSGKLGGHSSSGSVSVNVLEGVERTNSAHSTRSMAAGATGGGLGTLPENEPFNFSSVRSVDGGNVLGGTGEFREVVTGAWWGAPVDTGAAVVVAAPDPETPKSPKSSRLQSLNYESSGMSIH